MFSYHCPKCGERTESSGHMCPQPQPTTRPFACPVCGGQGHVAKPPWVPGDQNEWVSSTTETYPCKPCAGSGIVWGPA